MTEPSIEVLKKMVAAKPRAFFRPMSFFVARSGVLTLVFDGFSQAILDLKRRIEETFPHLEPEHEGSKWPKVTLGVLRDDEALARGDIVRLRDIADRWNDVLRQEGDVLDVNRLVAVEYACRSLERRRRTVGLPLNSESDLPDPPEDHAAYVQSIVSQFSREQMGRYSVEVEKQGHRESHYRSPARGWSLVADVDLDRLPLADRVMDEVERLVPDKYCRLSPESRHITIRSLNRVRTRRGRADIDVASSRDPLAD